MGGLIARLDRNLNRDTDPPTTRRRNGILALGLLLVVTAAPTIALTVMLRLLPYGWIGEALLAASLLAQKQLGEAVRAVADALDISLPAGRQAVGAIVGRDPETLDKAGVARAAIESLAENAADGIIAPLFWLLVLGLPGIAVYKAINTADSMIGHKSDRHLQFGWAAARLDDLANWIPSRLTGLLIVGAAFLLPGADGSKAWVAMLSDARAHDSPNAGWPEAAMAGALGLTLGGPRFYDGELHQLPRMGSGRTDLRPADIHAALRLYRTMLNLALACCLVLDLLAWL